jgi:protein arginine kinase
MTADTPMILDKEPWYAGNGPENDVAVSTRVCFSRNLANFPFPDFFRGDDADRIQSLVFDSFSHFNDPDNFHMIPVKVLDTLGKEVLKERGILETPAGTGVVMRNDGRAACTINNSDHIHISSFAPGLDCSGAFDICRSIDTGLQQFLQFAASYEYGYLTSSLYDAGSGMKLSLRVHLPSTADAGLVDSLVKEIQDRGFSISVPFGTGGRTGGALGAFYQISTKSSFLGTELDQIASLQSAGLFITETERRIRSECAGKKPTQVQNFILRSYALAKFSTMLSLYDAVEIISDLKWGIDLGIIAGSNDSALCALLYRIQSGHLEYLLHNGSFSFENDIKNSLPQKLERLRAIILQEALEKIYFI